MIARAETQPVAPAASKRSIARRTLWTVAARISLVLAVATILGYWHVRSGLERQALDSLSRYVEQRRVRESAIFDLASGHLRTFAEAYRNELRQTDPREAERRFAALFETRPDGTTRLTEDVFRIYGVTGFLGKHVSIDRDLKRRLVAAFELVARFGPAWAAHLPNLYVISPESAVIMYWPGQPWALNAADWEISGKLALLSDAGDAVVVAGSAPTPPGDRERWSELYFDYGVNDWLVSVTRPVVANDRHLISAGHDILLHALIDRAIGSDLAGTYNLIFSDGGQLIAHPRLMEAIQARSGRLTIRETGDPHLEAIYELAHDRRPDQIVLENRPWNEFVAVTRLSGPGWLMATVFPEAIAADQAWETARLILFLGVAALVIEILILSSVLKSEIARPLRQLVAATSSVASGRSHARLDIDRDDEIGELATAFTAMAHEVDARQAALNERSASLARLNEQLAHELEERRRAERELAHHRELNALLDAIEYGILFLDPGLHARIANRAYKHLWGIPDELIARGAHVSELLEHNRKTGIYGVPPQEWDAFVAGRLAAIRHGDIAPVEVRRADGRVLRYQCVALPDGGRMLTFLDVTDQKRAMDALEAAEQRQRRLLEVAPFPLAVTRLSDGRILYANARIAEAIGVPHDAVAGTFAPDFYANAADRTRMLDILIRDGRIRDFEVVMRAAGGREFWALINAAIAEFDGEPVLLAAFNDIAELKQREQQLLEAKRATEAALRDLNAVLDTIDYGVLFLNADLHARLTNRAYRELWRIPTEFYDQPRSLREDMEVSRANDLYGVADEDWDGYVEERIAAIRAGSIPPSELRLSDGKVIQYQCIALPDGGRMLTYFDITALKRTEDALREAKRHAEAANEAKSLFLANMSHELRTPLNAVLGYTELMLDGLYGELPERARTVVGRVQVNGRHLLGLINDILDLSKVEAGELKVANEPYSVAAIVQAVVAATEALARAKGLDLRIKVQDGLPLGRGDERRLTQVLLNLVGNAIKFTDHGAVEVRARMENGRFRIAVADTGPGIPKADRKRIFESFQQGDHSTTRKQGGTGLGLAISKRIAEIHGGEIEVESEIGRGSTFTVDLPVAAGTATEAA